jgi:hypothetical protein
VHNPRPKALAKDHFNSRTAKREPSRDQQPKDQLARAGSTGVHGPQHYIALIEGEHVRISTVIEKYLERVPTMLRDADDQHLVIIAQKVAAERRKSRAAARSQAGAGAPASATGASDGHGRAVLSSV